MEKTFLTSENGITRQEQQNLDKISNLVMSNVGTILDGKYEIKREIARGGMGIVYEAYHKYTHKRVAIKVVLAEKVEPIQLKRFQKEIEAYSLLSHPNVITIYDAGVYNNYPYIVMEYIEGVDICTYVKQYKEKKTPEDSKNESEEHKERYWKLCARLIYETALGLEYIHSKKMIHRDIKPANILVRPNGSPVIIDLGIVKFNRSQSCSLTKSRELLGTIGYMPIEQAQGKSSKVDERTDVYSLGLVLYELLTGTIAYSGESLMELCYKIVSYYPPLPRKIDAQIPEVLEEITIHATEKQQEKRYANMREFAYALKEYLSDSTIKPTSKYATIKYRLWLEQNKNKVITSCIVALLAIVLLIIVSISGSQSLEKKYQSALTYLEKQNFEKACHILEELSNQGNAEAKEKLISVYYQLGDMHYNKQNYKEAFEWFEKSAKQGYEKAQYKLGDMYANGQGVEHDLEKSVYWYQRVADQGNAEAKEKLISVYYQLGDMHYNKQDYKEAFKYFEKSAKQGYAEAQDKLGDMYANGDGVEQNLEEAVEWYEKSAKQGNTDTQGKLEPIYFQLGNMFYSQKKYKKAVEWYEKSANQENADAQLKLGLMYYKGYGVDKADAIEAFVLFEKSANQGNAQAQYQLGLMYYNGDGIEEDNAIEEAFEWFKKSAMQGNVEAQYQLGLMYYKGDGVDKADAREAFEWFKKSAMQGNAEAQYQLGLMYYNGDGVDKDAREAFEWFKKSAMQENAQAQYQLGLIYYKDKDAIKAFEWFEKSAMQENADAQYQLGLMYYNGDRVDKDAIKAFEWFKKSAMQENAEAQYQLGLMYYNGDGVKKDAIEAFEWYKKSAEQGNADAQLKLGDMYANGESYDRNGYSQGIIYGYGFRVNRSDDYKEAIKWYTKSAEQGNVDAQIRLADLLMKIKNYEKQRENYEKQFRRNSNAGSKKINTQKNNTKSRE